MCALTDTHTYITHLVFHHHEEESNVEMQNTFLRMEIKYLPAMYHETLAVGANGEA